MTLVPILSYSVVGQALARRGREPIVLDDTFIDVDTAISLGILPTLPTKFNTGLIPGVARETSFGLLNITVPGTTIENRDHYGVIKINAPNVTLRNVGVYGPDAFDTTYDYLVDCRPQACVNARLERVLLKPKYPTWTYTGVIGHDYTAYRCLATWLNDGFGVYRTQQYNVDSNVVIESNWCDELAFFTGPKGVVHPSDTKTHNDCIQLQGGNGTIIRGNWLGGFLSTDPSVGTQDFYDTRPQNQANAAVMVNSNVGNTQNTVFDYNWVDGGSYNVNCAPITGNVGTFNHNRFGRKGLIIWNGLPATLVFSQGGVFTASANVFDDNDQPILIRTNG